MEEFDIWQPKDQPTSPFPPKDLRENAFQVQVNSEVDEIVEEGQQLRRGGRAK
jgi:hypothetical protein